MTRFITARFALQRDAFALDIQCKLPARGVTAVVGESGAGKSTLLRCLAGLERADGYLDVDGHCWQDDEQGLFLPACQRQVGVVFQEPRLFAHLCVRDNLLYGLRRKGRSLEGGQGLLDEVVHMLGIEALLDRYPEKLSGGESQRVAIGRALLTSPRLLLMDEPLAGLDRGRRQALLPFLERLHQRLDIPIIYVSHHMDEVTRIADQLLLLDNGQALGVGLLNEMLARLDLPLASAADASVVLEGRLVGHDHEFALVEIETRVGRLWAPAAHLPVAAEGSLRLRIHARDVSISRQRPVASTILNVFEATVEARIDVGVDSRDGGAITVVRLNAGGAPLLARVTRRSAHELGLAVAGTSVYAQVKGVVIE